MFRLFSHVANQVFFTQCIQAKQGFCARNEIGETGQENHSIIDILHNDKEENVVYKVKGKDVGINKDLQKKK